MAKFNNVKKILVWVLGVLIVLGLGLYCGFTYWGSRVISKCLGEAFESDVSVARASLSFPKTGVVVSDLAIEGVANVDKVYVYLNLAALLSGRFEDLDVILERPVLFLKRDQDAVLMPAFGAADPVVQQEAVVGSVNMPEGVDDALPNIIVRSVVVRNGRIEVDDRKLDRLWIVEGVAGELNSLPITGGAVKTDIELTASAEKVDLPFLGNFITAKGWLNWAARDMDVALRAVDDDGRVGLDIQLLSKSNDMKVSGHVRLTGSQQAQALGHKMGVMEHLVLGFMDAIDTDIEAAFSFNTAMDRFELKKVALEGQITQGLNSVSTSGNIVDNLKAVGKEFLREAVATSAQEVEADGAKVTDTASEAALVDTTEAVE